MGRRANSSEALAHEYVPEFALYAVDGGVQLSLYDPMVTEPIERGAETGAQEIRLVQRGGAIGSLCGVLVFLGGIALLALTFKLSYDMFTTDPALLFNRTQGKTLDLNQAATELMGVLVKILLLLVMAIVGGVITNRGKNLYIDSRHSSKPLLVPDRGLWARSRKSRSKDAEKD